MPGVETQEVDNLAHGDISGSVGNPSDPTRPPAPGMDRLPTRRELRAAENAKAVRPRRDSATRTLQTPAPRLSPAPTGRSRRTKAANAVVMTFVTGLVGVMAIPAYAAGSSLETTTSAEGTSLQDYTAANAQVVTADSASSAPVEEEGFTATSVAELNEQKAAAARAALAEQRRTQLASTATSYTGASATQLASNPIYQGTSASGVSAVARQYLGVPYVFGGETPAGFDCSGLVKYVFAQFGLNLPHSVRAQHNAGRVVSRAEALPGDIVVWNDFSHDGIYTGNGIFIDAPKPGDHVKERPIWSQNVHFVRLLG
ncbi:peptidoglycan endopeptidase [Clavibacter michiganensis]|uniref:Peptidoglycan endopeptidase n=2 Tax=Clavibacter michiganensis TaxID=28447 RepID=A0A2S5VSX9_9MICO|nr:peptidoglycan endopeptidase [Clavibacter michiganensis]